MRRLNRDTLLLLHALVLTKMDLPSPAGRLTLYEHVDGSGRCWVVLTRGGGC